MTTELRRNCLFRRLVPFRDNWGNGSGQSEVLLLRNTQEGARRDGEGKRITKSRSVSPVVREIVPNGRFDFIRSERGSDVVLPPVCCEEKGL